MFDDTIVNISMIQKVACAESDSFYIYIGNIDEDVEQSFLIEDFDDVEMRDNRFEELNNILCSK
jgi:hypothetical protein